MINLDCETNAKDKIYFDPCSHPHLIFCRHSNACDNDVCGRLNENVWILGRSISLDDTFFYLRYFRLLHLESQIKIHASLWGYFDNRKCRWCVYILGDC